MWPHFAALLQTRAASPDWLPIVLFVAAVVGVPLGIYLFYRGFSLLARKRLLQNIPASSIRGAAMGQVELSGKAAGPYTILSPLSQTDCYYYKAEAHVLEEEGNRNAVRGQSVEILSVPFFLEDETGSVMIDARGADTDLTCTFDAVESAYSAGDCVSHFMARRGLPNARARLVEYCVVDGDRLFVLGTLAENPPANQNEASAETDFLSREAAALQRQTVLEYMHVPVPDNLRSSTSAPPGARSFNLCPPVVLRKGESGEPYIISRQSQRDLVEALAGQSFLYIWGGPILALSSLAYLLLRLAWW
jgi:E3 Ubiquitin ligase